MTSLLGSIFKGRDKLGSRAQALAAGVMSAARRPGLYESGFAQDTLEGRFSMVALHGSLVIRHLRKAGGEGFSLAERMGEILFDRFDYALREEGVGDHSIARRMRKLGEEFYGLARALDDGLESDGDGALEDALTRNVDGAVQMAGLTAYVRACDAQLAGLDRARLLDGRVSWPDAANPLHAG